MNTYTSLILAIADKGNAKMINPKLAMVKLITNELKTIEPTFNFK